MPLIPNQSIEYRLDELEKKVRDIEINLAANSEIDNRVSGTLHEEINDIRLHILRIENAGCRQLINNGNSNAEDRKKLRKIDRNNMAIGLAALILFVLYLKDDIAAGHMADAILSLLVGGGFAGYSIYENRREDRR